MAQASLFRYKLLYFALFTAYGLLIPYVPIFYEDLGMSKSEIGILAMLPNMCTFMVAPVFGFIGDKFRAHEEVLIGTLIVSSISTVTMLYMNSFESQLPIVILLSIFRAPIGPQIDSVVMAALEDKTAYGTIRLWGAVSFGIFSLVGGIVTTIPTGSNTSTEDGPFMIIFYLFGLCFLLSGFIILWIVSDDLYKKKVSNQNKLAEERRNSPESKDHSDMMLSQTETYDATHDPSHFVGMHSGNADLIMVEAASDLTETLLKPQQQQQQHTSNITTTNLQSRADSVAVTSNEGSNEGGKEGGNEGSPEHRLHMRAALRKVVRDNPSVLIFAVVVFLSGFGAGAIDSYLFIYLKELGGTGLLMGLARFMTCVAEVPMFQIAGPLQKKYGTWLMLVCTQLAFVVRFLYYVFLQEPWTVLPCEMLNGITFAVTWNVSCTYANEISPPGCQSIMQSVLEGLHFGIGYGIGSLVGGFVYQYYGAVRLFEFCGVLSLASAVLAVCAWRYNPPSSDGNTSVDAIRADRDTGKATTVENIVYTPIAAEDKL